MTAELAALAALFKPQMSCVVRANGKVRDRFSSVNSQTPDGLLLYQRNYEPGFSEIIVYAYAAKQRRYARTQLSDDGDYAAATSPGPVDGVWSWTGVKFSDAAPASKPHVLRWQRQNGVSRYWYEGTPFAGECR